MCSYSDKDRGMNGGRVVFCVRVCLYLCLKRPSRDEMCLFFDNKSESASESIAELESDIYCQNKRVLVCMRVGNATSGECVHT